MVNLFILCIAQIPSIILQVSERFTPEEEVVLPVLNYTNHPLFNITEGPIGGHDIGVYFVDDEILRKPGVIKKGKLYPACLPSKAHKSKRGIFAGNVIHKECPIALLACLFPLKKLLPEITLD